jgi:hypothetical protein
VSKAARPQPIIEARLEVIDARDDVREDRGTVELTPEQRAAAEAEKCQLLTETRGPRLDDGPRARRLGRTRPEGMVDPDMPSVEEDAVPPAVVPSEDDVMNELRRNARRNLGITPGRASATPSRAPEPVDTGDADDTNPDRRQIELSPEEIAALEAEREQLVAQIRSSRPVESDVEIEVPAEGDIEIPSSPELEAAAAVVAGVDAEIAALETERKAAEKQRAEQIKAEAAAHQAKVDELRRKHDAAEAARQQALQKQASIELKQRAEKARQAATKELERRVAAQSDRNERFRARVQPVIDNCRKELAELDQFAEENMKTLTDLSRQSARTCPATWEPALRMEFQREVSGNAYRLMMDLKRSLDGFPRHLKTLEDFLRDGYDEAREQEYVQALYEASISRPGVPGDGITAAFRRDLARLNEIAAEVYDKGAYFESLGTIYPFAESAITREEQAYVKSRLLGRDIDSLPKRAIMDDPRGFAGPAHTQEMTPTEAYEALQLRKDGAVRDAGVIE